MNTVLKILAAIAVAWLLWLWVGPALASGPANYLQDDIVIGPYDDVSGDCRGLKALAPWSGCHEPKPHPVNDSDTPTVPIDPKTPEGPKDPPPTDECASLWVPGQYANSTVPDEGCP